MKGSQRVFNNIRVLTEREVGRPKLRIRNPVRAGELEYLVQSVYDFFSVAVNTATRREQLFSIPIGQAYTGAGGAALTKNIYHTNLVLAGVLANPDKQIVKAVCVVPRSDIHPTDNNLFLGNGLIQFECSGKNYLTELASKCPAGAGAFASGTLNNVNSSSNGWPAAGNIATVVDAFPQIPGLPEMPPILGVLIEQGQNFTVIYDPTLAGAGTGFTTLTTAAGGQGITAHVRLEGVKARAVL